jgi:hypothetical protein
VKPSTLYKEEEAFKIADDILSSILLIE